MRALLLLVFCLCVPSFAETWNASSGIAIGSGGVQITAPKTGQIPELSYEKGSLALDFSIFGRGGSQPANQGPVRILRPITSGGGALTNSEDFFRGVGKPAPVQESTRRRR